MTFQQPSIAYSGPLSVSQPSSALAASSQGVSRTKRPFLTFQDLSKVPEADVLALFAHPDDEVLVSGTLSQLSRQGKSVQAVYVTDGSAGRDVSGRCGPGHHLGHLRRHEVVNSLKSIGVQRKPLILDFMDGQISRYPAPVIEQLRAILLQTRPEVVMTFRSDDGMTNHPDHKAVGDYTDQLLQALHSGKTSRDRLDQQTLGTLPTIYHAAMSESGLNVFQHSFPPDDSSWKDMVAIPDQSLDVWVPLALSDRLKKQEALSSHASQFPKSDKLGFWQYGQNFPFETFQSTSFPLPTDG